ncbi:hypothetical protein EJ05DRAFT_506773 [Pseudovirgaria hyperparasitica]|uniref:Uncharacterized protein n=1 Tax=Pseudovirgaria hyperparasitica TaxID=470096 RepID=A0A6A6WLW3_9PEZI|nr:uncharacterized protein EJ05DRAFT_506773 [Pseudovirgaria hyperparasitica]KAF2763148.1 hypothetical protein EJ05DRAFT_506773 [Pseudovirgaria hyperparasitica]
MKTTFAALALTLTLTSTALGASISALNNCGTSIWVKADSQSSSGPITEIAAGATWTANLETTQQGNAVKFSNSNTDFTKPISFDYSVTNGVNYYDVSNAAGQPFSLAAADTQGGSGACPSVMCPGSDCQAVKTCGSDRSFNIRAC